MPNAELQACKERMGANLVITGGWDRLSDAAKLPDAPEEMVRQSARVAIDTYGKDGGLIFWDGGIIKTYEGAQQKSDWLYDEVDKYGREVYRG
jgi:hypothetical protein